MPWRELEDVRIIRYSALLLKKYPNLRFPNEATITEENNYF
jgi:hypothetical protein